MTDWRRRAVVESAKLERYLLSREHPHGRQKAQFFERFGFTQDNAPVLHAALLDHVAGAALLEAMNTPFGQKFVLEGSLKSPDGRNPLVRSIWFEEREGGAVKLVTAYPAGARR